jgi:hypothetical protein
MSDQHKPGNENRPSKPDSSPKPGGHSNSLLTYFSGSWITPKGLRGFASSIVHWKEENIRHSQVDVNFQVLPLRTTRSREHLVPQAIISEPVETFARIKPATIEEDSDNLDYYKGIAYALNDIPFAVMHHRGNPKNTSTIYLPKSIRSVDQITGIIDNIIACFKLPPSSLIWQRKDDPDL